MEDIKDDQVHIMKKLLDSLPVKDDEREKHKDNDLFALEKTANNNGTAGKSKGPGLERELVNVTAVSSKDTGKDS